MSASLSLSPVPAAPLAPLAPPGCAVASAARAPRAQRAVVTALSKRIFRIVDLYCGGGGFTQGAVEAAEQDGYEIDVLAINHWPEAIETHLRNHPRFRHICNSVECVVPRTEVPEGWIDLLLASPSCTHFSHARGGQPMSDQERSSPWRVLEWCTELDVKLLLLENVKEFQDWGPLHPCLCGAEEQARAAGKSPEEIRKVDHQKGHKCYRPIEALKGTYFRSFVRNLKALGYRVEWKVLNAANYGAYTSRERFFLMARKGGGKIHWPEVTHERPQARAAAQQSLDLAPARQPWKPARDVIQWDVKGTSIYGRDKPLVRNTLARIYAGLFRFSTVPILTPDGVIRPGQSVSGKRNWSPETLDALLDRPLEPFLVVFRNHGDGRSLGLPVPTITAGGQHFGLAEPMLLPHQHGNSGPTNVRSVEEVFPTITGTSADMFLAHPYLASVQHGQDLRTRDLSDPLATVTGKGGWGLLESYLVNMKGRSNASDIDRPTPTITAHAQHLCVAEPAMQFTEAFMLGQQSGAAPRPTGQPVPTVSAAGAISLVDSYLVPQFGERDGQVPRTHGLGTPLPAVTSHGAGALIEPHLSRYHGSHAGRRDGADRSQSLDQPIGVVDTSNRYALVELHLLHYHGNGGPESLQDPLQTITTRDRFALVHPTFVQAGLVDGAIVGWLDILFRMLLRQELSLAMSFPKSYYFAGNREDQVKMVGNAVDVTQARVLCGKALWMLATSRPESWRVKGAV